jgi:prolyl-tRNA synthetase
MTHADDDGMVIPPRLAPAHAVILPVLRGDDTKTIVMEAVDKLRATLKSIRYHDRLIDVEVDARDIRGGEKSWDWVKKGIPLRIEIGPRDVEAGTVMVARRDKTPRDKQSMKVEELAATITTILDEMQAGLFDRALAYRKEHTRMIDSRGDFDAFFTPKNVKIVGGDERPEIHGGFALAHWSGEASVETELKEKLKVTIRNIPEGIPEAEAPGTCIFTGKPSPRRVLFSKAY